MHYKLVKININALRLAKVIIDIIVEYHNLPDSIISDRRAIFISKFWSLLYYLLDIKKQFSTAFHPKIDGQIKKQENTIEEYFCVLMN